MVEEGPLEELENLIKSNFSDLVVSLAVSAKGSLFLSSWQPPSDVSPSKTIMEYLPLFYLIASVDETSARLTLKLISYHGVVIEDLYEKDQPLTGQEKLCFIKRLVNMQLCQGVAISDGIKLDSSYLVEKIEQNIIVRSRHCNFGIDSTRKVCEACKNSAKEIVADKRVLPRLNSNEDSHAFPEAISSVDSSQINQSLSTIDKDSFALQGVKVETTDEDNIIHNDAAYFDMETAEKLMDQTNSLLSYPTLEKEDMELDEVYDAFKTKKDTRKTSSKKLRLDRSKKHHVGPFLCDQCGQTFTYADELKLHLDETSHESNETAVCFQCGDIFDSRIAFRKHLWLHENFRPYKCKHCEFTSTVKEHVYNQHAMYSENEKVE